ncbi:hypothetical protein JCM6882_001856 [Rhodosporidiobolus microsporus]
MDPFEIRMQFVALVSRLTSSVPSISKVASFALKHASRASDDIWDCYLDEIASANLNSRINLLYLVDALLDKEGPKVVSRGAGAGIVGTGSYRALVERDLAKVVKNVVPETREGVLNWMSTHQVLRSWKTRRLLDSDVLDAVTAELEDRKAALHSHSDSSDTTAFANFSRNDILRRIEDDRERHKRLKERIWVLPVPSTIYPTVAPASSALANSSAVQKPSPISPASPFDPSSRPASSSTRRQSLAAAAQTEKPPPVTAGRGPELALEMEFEQLWEASEEERKAAQGAEGAVEEGEFDPERPAKRLKPWALDEGDREEMRSERWRCFEPEKEDGEV